ALSPSSPGRYFWSAFTGSGMISALSRLPVIATNSYRLATTRNHRRSSMVCAILPPRLWRWLLQGIQNGLLVPVITSSRSARGVAENRDDTALADPPAAVRAPGQHVVEVGYQVDADVVDRGRGVDREVHPGRAGAHPGRPAVAGSARFRAHPQSAVGVPGTS